MTIIVYEVTGIRPLLSHNPAAMAEPDGKVTTKKVPTAEDEAKAGRYLTDDGKFLQFPAGAFKKSFVTGATGRKLSKRSASAVLKGTIFPAEEWVLLLNPKTGKQIKADDYEIDTRPVVLKSMGKSVRVLRSRPKVNEWSCKVAFEIDDDILDTKNLEEIGNMAGRRVGVGDNRPESGGNFGRYTVRLVA
jgi:hypothetical protein